MLLLRKRRHRPPRRRPLPPSPKHPSQLPRRLQRGARGTVCACSGPGRFMNPARRIGRESQRQAGRCHAGAQRSCARSRGTRRRLAVGAMGGPRRDRVPLRRLRARGREFPRGDRASARAVDAGTPRPRRRGRADRPGSAVRVARGSERRISRRSSSSRSVCRWRYFPRAARRMRCNFVERMRGGVTRAQA